MTEPSTIKCIGRKEIEDLKWNNCIENATNGLIYAHSYYLDRMADNWEALVKGDYEAVMPLTYKKKYGIYYLTQPMLTAQLGLFGKDLGAEDLRDFLNAVPGRYKYCDIYLNHQNLFEVKGYQVYQRSNYILDLSKRYVELEANYRESTKRNIKRAEQVGSVLVKDIDVHEVINLALAQMHTKTGDTYSKIKQFRELYLDLHQREKAKCYGILSLNKELVASAVFFFSHGRAYYILVGNHPNGKTIGASHALIDGFIRDHSGKPLLLDFEGSDIQSLAFFYSSFGAVEEKYAALKFNRLPFFLKWMK